MEENKSEDNGTSLRYVFAVAQKQFEDIEKSSSSSTELQPIIRECITKMRLSKELVLRNALFSPNEELDDVPTSSLRYILVDYYLGHLYTQIFTKDEHLQELKLAKMFLSSFLNVCKQFKLVHNEDVKSFQRETPADAATRRAEKISRAKREKEISQKLQELLKKQTEGTRKSEKGYIQSNKSEEDEDDEEVSRNIYTALIQSSVYKAITLLDSTNQELEMLQHVDKLKKENNGKLPPPPERTTPPFKNYTILPNQRVQVLNEVFVNRNPATMTPEQWAEDQMRRGLLPTPEGYEKEKAEQLRKKQEEEEKQDTDETFDRQTMKDREDDEWKDNTPKGIGNKNDNYFKRS